MNRDLNRLNNLIYGDDVFVASGGSEYIISDTSNNNMTDVNNYIGGTDSTSLGTLEDLSDSDGGSVLSDIMNKVQDTTGNITKKGVEALSDLAKDGEEALSDLAKDGEEALNDLAKDGEEALGKVVKEGENIIDQLVNKGAETTKGLFGQAKKLLGMKGGMDADQLVDYLLETETDVAPMRQMGGHYDPELQQRLQRFFS